MGKRHIIYSYTEGGGPSPMDERPEGASETFSRGAPLVDDGSGRLEEAGTNDTDWVGFALEDGHNNSTEGAAIIGFVKALPSTVFQGYIDDGSSEGTGASAATQVGQEYGLTKASSGGAWYVDINKTGANGRVRVQRLIDDAGTTLGRVLFKVTSDQLDLNDS